MPLFYVVLKLKFINLHFNIITQTIYKNKIFYLSNKKLNPKIYKIIISLFFIFRVIKPQTFPPLIHLPALNHKPKLTDPYHHKILVLKPL